MYDETVRVDTADVEITAEDPSNPPTVRYEPAEPKNNATFEIIANGVVLSNLTIERVGHPNRTGDNVTAGVAIVPVDSGRPTCIRCNDVTKDVVIEDGDIAGGFELEDANAGVDVTGNAIHDNLATPNGPPHGTGVDFVRNRSEGSFSDLVFTGNDVTDNHYGVRIAGNETNETLADVDASTITVNQNDVVNNSEWGALNDGTNVLDAGNNRWGDSDGPSGEGDGGGDAASTGVDFDPWLTEPVT